MAKTTKSYRIDTLDIESQGYTVDEAMRELRYFIEEMKKGNKIIAKVIHGYGSTGTGGASKRAWRILRNCKANTSKSLSSRNVILLPVSRTRESSQILKSRRRQPTFQQGITLYLFSGAVKKP